MTSPFSSPASKAALPLFTPEIKTPNNTGISFSFAISAVTSWIVIPNNAL